MIFGAHVSTSKGLIASLEYAESVGCECIQLFAKSPRQWRGAAVDRGAAQAFRTARAERDFGPVFTHTAYLINLGTVDDEMREKSIAALADELTRASILGADGVVSHLGNDSIGDSDAAAQRIAGAILAAYRRADLEEGAVRLLLENTAGAGKTYGSSFAELGAVIGATGLPAATLGICFDTCHGFAWGYDLTGESGWATAVEDLRAHVGLDRLGLIHANDCMFPRGSKRDRHAWIGQGEIGRDGFRAMVCQPLLAGTPVVTEMPGEVPEKDALNVGALKEMRDACA